MTRGCHLEKIRNIPGNTAVDIFTVTESFSDEKSLSYFFKQRGCFGFDLQCRCNEVSHVSRLFFQATSESVLSHNSCLTNPVIFILSLMFSHHAGWVIYSVVSRLMVSEHTCGI